MDTEPFDNHTIDRMDITTIAHRITKLWSIRRLNHANRNEEACLVLNPYIGITANNWAMNKTSLFV